MEWSTVGESYLDFKEGDLVRLNTGGPLMTVTMVDGPIQGSVRTQWFVGEAMEKGAFHRKELMFVTLTPYEFPVDG